MNKLTLFIFIKARLISSEKILPKPAAFNPNINHLNFPKKTYCIGFLFSMFLVEKYSNYVKVIKNI